MLQDAIWADTVRLADDPAYADAAVRFLKAVTKGWIFARDNPEEAADDRLRRRDQRRSRLPGGSGAPAVADERGQQAHLGRRTTSASIDQAAWDKTVAGALSAGEPGRDRAHHHRARGVGILERVHRAGARRTRRRRAWRSAANTRRSTSTLTEGGQ